MSLPLVFWLLVVVVACAAVTSIAIAYESDEDGYHTESSFGLVGFEEEDHQVHQNRDQDLFDEEEEDQDDTFFQHSQKQQRYHHLNGPSPSEIHPRKPRKRSVTDATSKIRDVRSNEVTAVEYWNLCPFQCVENSFQEAII